MSLATLISLLAAFGVGSIFAAVVSRWNTISQLRQAWIDKLRQEIADFFLAVEQVGEAAFGHGEIRKDIRSRRDHALSLFRQIQLKLNYREIQHRQLDRRLAALLQTQGSIDNTKLEVALITARRVLKAEWERTKFGPLVDASRFWKRMKRRFRLARRLLRG